jgi:cytochrome c-type biogenesis protein CcmH/NrfG
MLCRLFRSAAIFSAFFLFAVIAQAQRGTRATSIPLQIHGQIRYAAGNQPAEFMLVRLESFSGGVAGEVTTDRTGRFTFTRLLPDLYVLSVRTAGYREVQYQVDMRTQVTDYVQLQLVAEDSGYRSSLPAKPNGVINAKVPQAALSEFEKGRDALSQPNHSDEGILHLENAVRMYPQYLEATLLLGTAYMDKRDWVRAEAKLQQVLIIEPNTVGAHFALGELYLRQKKYSEAEKEMLAGLKLDPKSVQGHFMLGRLYYDLGDIVKAGPQIGTALQLDPKFARGHLLAANMYLHARQPENAIVEFEEFLRLEPNGEFSAPARETVRKIRQALTKS